ncbi:hypothetical protein [Janthinobacterium sp. GW458P]|uniref:hypothetical protein n=1 Tax=Janthinobacterium sp. GW458P TaxID=1981504 RepID=UPI001123151F|nr:hypothetical protein [Janthinobacterium sp. GW458P]MBE3023058.1 hypothetical protein [Janthinobacterium sp. GW458P]
MALDFRHLSKNQEYLLTAIITLICGFFATGVLIWTAWTISPNGEVLAKNYLIILIAFLLGWTTGMYLSPYDRKEALKFVTIGQAISAFLSGYVLSKFDRFIENFLFGKNKLPIYDNWIHLGMFLASFLVACILVFTARAYFDIEEREGKVKINTV